MNKFVTFEGCEGCGKSTQSKLLYDSLKALYGKVTLTREPGGTLEAESVRNLITDSNYAWHYRSEILLHMAARNEHLQNLILPDLKEEFFVICDRYLDSTIAYQGYGLGAKISTIEDIYEIIAGDFMPSLTFILDIEASASYSRLESRNKILDRYESMDREFHNNVRKGFQEIAIHNPKRCVLINGNMSIENIHYEIIGIMKDIYEMPDLIPAPNLLK